ncbi:hypothetical protein ABH905_003856 [Pseudomonas frederiksbergensis]
MACLPAQLAHQSIAAHSPLWQHRRMTSHPNLDQLNPEELRALAAQLIQCVEAMDKLT